MAKSNAEAFVQVLLEQKDLSEIVKQYDDLRASAVINSDEYDEVITLLCEKKQGWWGNQEEKYYIHETMSEVSTLLNEDVQNGEVLQRLIDFVGEKCECWIQVAENEKWRNNSKIRYFLLHLVIDLVFSYREESQWIKLSAMLYDLMRQWNQENNFAEFYGDSAEEAIVSYSYENIVDASMRIGKVEPKQLIDDASKNFKRDYIVQFCNLLSDMDKKKTERHNGPQASAKAPSREKEKFLNWKTILLVSAVSIAVLFLGVKIYSLLMSGNLQEKEQQIQELKEEIETNQEKYEKLQEEYDKLEKSYGELKTAADNTATGPVREEIDISSSNNGSQKGGDITESSSGNTVSGNTESGNLKVGDTYIADTTRNVRSSKTIFGDNILGEIQAGEGARVVEEMDENGWFGISFEDQIGYIKL